MNEDQAQQTQQKRQKNKTRSGWVFKAGVFLVLILLLVIFGAWNEKRDSEVISVAENASEFSDKDLGDETELAPISTSEKEEEEKAGVGCLGSGFYFEGKPEEQFNNLRDAFNQFKEPEKENREPQWSNWLHNGDEIAEFVNKHPIICDINETYALVYKLSDEALAQSTSGPAKTQSAVYLKNKIKGQEVLLYEKWDFFMPGIGDTYSIGSGGMRGLFFEILPGEILDIATLGVSYGTGSWENHKVVDLNNLKPEMSYEFSFKSFSPVSSPSIKIEDLDTEKIWTIEVDFDHGEIGEVNTLGVFNINGISVNGVVVHPFSITLNPVIIEPVPTSGKRLVVNLDFWSGAPDLGPNLSGSGEESPYYLKQFVRFNEDFSKARFNLVIDYKTKPVPEYDHQALSDEPFYNESIDLGEIEISLD